MSENTAPPEPYGKLQRELRELALLGSARSVLQWDQETLMPPAASELRGDQLALLSGLLHQRWTDPQVGDWISECEADPDLMADPRVAANLRELRRDYDHSIRLPPALVRELAKTRASAQTAWRDARERSDYGAFAPWLARVLELSRAKAEHLADPSTADRYDALLDQYEPGARAGQVEEVFRSLRARLMPLIQRAAEQSAPDLAPLHVRLPIAQQREFNRFAAARIGFDLDAGRLDTSTHPFCQGIGPGDTRLTTRYAEDRFFDALSSTLHEAGHGLYEQGLPKEQFPGQPLADAASLGIHESQSRLWENLVGRSLHFWRWALPHLKERFGAPVESFSADSLFRALNAVQPNLIRVDSDEATYNLHIMLRFDLERALLSGDLSVDDLPGAWNERIRADLGLQVPDDRLGCLQDVHWSMGAFGYFPTYTLGNLYAAQFWAAARHALPELDEQLARGEFTPLLEWLRRHIHARGRELPALQLCERVTGERISEEPFIAYLEDKIDAVYGRG